MATTDCRECTELQRYAYDPDRPADAPTNGWHCRRCNRHINRYRGQGDQQCTCGAWYNAGGTLLRDDWQSNPAWHDHDIDDLEGYELSQLAKEAHLD